MSEVKPKTRAELEAALAESQRGMQAQIDELRRRHDKAVDDRRQSIEREAETRAQFNDLKTRLATAEADNQRMRGYIARVQEDDVVREELLTTGDPQGEQYLVPKRKLTPFHQPDPFTERHDGAMMADASYGRHERRERRHWVTY